MLLIALGFSVGALGTLIGVGGGFILVPILLWLYPEAGNVWITAVSLWLVAMNATSGSTTYFLKGKVHLKAAVIFCLASLPGSLLGVWLEPFVSRSIFELIFGLALIVYALVLFVNTKPESRATMTNASPLGRDVIIKGAAISFVVGFAASFLGIGGGVIHVPLLAQVLAFPVHLATGTSHFILALTAWFTTALHLYRGDISLADPVLWQLGVSAIFGAQLGAYLSPRVPAHVIMRILAVALALVGARLTYAQTFGRVVEHKAIVSGVPDFLLLDQNGVNHSLFRAGDKRAIVIIGHGNSCPILQKSTRKINELAETYAAKGVEVWMINPNSEDDRKSIIQEANDFGLKVPVLLDPSQIVTRQLGLTRTSEAVIIVPGTWNIVYRGPIDDELGYGVDKQRVGHHFLQNALDDLLAVRQIAHPEEPTKGCLFSFFSKKELSFTKDIQPILEEKCLNCHSRGMKFQPFLDGHEKLKKWAPMMRETLFTERMPPFSGDSYYAKFKNDISLSPEQKRLMVEWIDAGMPWDAAEENPFTHKGPPPQVAAVRNETPIFVAAMAKESQIPPGGTLEYQYYQLGGEIPEDYWIHAVNTVTTNPRQLHHESLMIVPHPLAYYENQAKGQRDDKMVEDNTDGDIPIYTLSSMMREQANRRDPNYLRFQTWGAGRKQPFLFGEKFAMHLPKGYYLVLEVHYMGTGKDDTEKTTVEFYGDRESKGRQQMHVMMLKTANITIPPGDKNYEVKTAPFRVGRDIDLHGFLGHMHMRGRAIRLVSIDPKGQESTVMSIPNFYYGWQTGAGLALETPARIPAGSRLQVICQYDNSPQNPNNPDPQKTVHFGQTVDRTEMCHLNTQYTFAQ